MTMEFPRKSFTDEAIRLGKSNDYIKATLEYADALNLNSVPVLFSLVHFAIASRCNHRALLAIIKNSENYYKVFEFKKKRGGTRKVSAPFPILKKAQSYINSEILSNIPVSDHAYAYCKNKSIVDNANVHIGQPYIRTFDISNFFSSIPTFKIYEIFKNIGYAKNLAVDLSKLCTSNIDDEEFFCLPQGSPASPALSNLVMRNFDYRMSSFAGQNDLKYSRYADDFTFSGNLDKLPKISFIRKVLESEGFDINPNKTRTYSPNSNKRIVTGLLVSDRVRTPPKYKEEIFQHFYYLRKFGPKEHVEYMNEKIGFQRNYYYEWIQGKLLFLNMVEPEIAKPLLEELITFDWPIINNVQNKT